MRPFLALTIITLMFSCVASSGDRSQVISHYDKDRIESLVGKTVGESKHPYINGIGCWKLDEYRGKMVRVIGTISKSIVIMESIYFMNSEMIANEGTGEFYEIVNIESITVVK